MMRKAHRSALLPDQAPARLEGSKGQARCLAWELPSIPLKAMVATNLPAFVLGWREERARTRLGRTVRATEANKQSKKIKKLVILSRAGFPGCNLHGQTHSSPVSQQHQTAR